MFRSATVVAFGLASGALLVARVSLAQQAEPSVPVPPPVVAPPAPAPLPPPTPAGPAGPAAAPTTPTVLPSADITDVSPPSVYRSAGYRNGTFLIHSPDDVFRLYIMGRVHADWADQLAAGASRLPPGTGINDGFYLRRARLELAGEFFETWQWQIGAEFSSSTAIDNAAAAQATPTCTVSSTAGAPNCTTVQTNPVEAATVKPIPTDVFVNYGPTPWANLQVGQFYLPFTLENRISDNTTPFLERSMAVRNLGAPLQRDVGAMFWGESPSRGVYYAVAVLNGDGPNRVNVDTRYDFAGRLVVRPFGADGPMRWGHFGVSAKYGSRDPAKVGYDLPALTTQEGFSFWKPTYKDSSGRLMHIIPSAEQWGLAGDVYVPWDGFDFTGEFVYLNDNTREAVDGFQISRFTERTGKLYGYSWYAQASYWLVGSHDIIGYPSYGRPIHVDLSKPQQPPQHGVQVLAKFEQLHLTYDGASRSGVANPKTPNGDINVQDVELGINYWATRHLRVGLNYTVYMFPDSAPVSASSKGGPVQSSGQRALAPGQLLAAGVDDGARDGGHTLHEISARVGVQF
jgi:phosphate-selective porin